MNCMYSKDKFSCNCHPEFRIDNDSNAHINVIFTPLHDTV